MKTPVKTKNTRSPLTINKVANKPLLPSGFKTATGAQQYIRGKTSKERSDNALAFFANGPASSAMMAAFAAEGARNISNIVGPKKAKTDSAVAMYNRMEARNAATAAKERAAMKKKK